MRAVYFLSRRVIEFHETSAVGRGNKWLFLSFTSVYVCSAWTQTQIYRHFGRLFIPWSCREQLFFPQKVHSFYQNRPKNKTPALRFASEHEGKRAEMSGKWWRLNAKALMMGKSSGVHYHHVRCETLVYSEMMSVCKQEVALRVCVCVCLHMSTDGWVDQAVFVFTVHRLNMMRYFTYFIHERHRYTSNAIVLERKPWKTAIVCSSSVSPKVLWVIL